ncbi:hypothetical protein MTR_3g060580 [Medicago truncatula]|uniref:Uncharacterized protein n=1 Tax=Medicago truncatula TaxID=3880 RepID=G7IXR2_MEDTR|nr:hypothetical protein MTR_3g060580 [Medicago truncatula]
MASVSCTPKPLDVLNGFQQVKKTKDLKSLPSFSFGLTELEEEERNGFCELYSKTIFFHYKATEITKLKHCFDPSIIELIKEKEVESFPVHILILRSTLVYCLSVKNNFENEK